MNTKPYMDAHNLQSIQFLMPSRNRLQPYIRIFYEATASIPDGIR
ncbi:MAG: hypothetical protein ABL903_14785 [Methylococcales bacterium]